MARSLYWLDPLTPACAVIGAARADHGIQAPRAPATADPHFSEPLCEFIKRHLRTVDDVELLLLLHEGEGRRWSLSELSGTLALSGARHVDPAECMNRFIAAGIAVVEGWQYRYAPRTAAVRAAVDGVAAAYRERPVSLVRLVYYLRSHRFESFADAFRLARD